MEFKMDAFSQFDKKWALLCAGSGEHYNAMTISWGGMGTLWSKPVATVYVKPIRYTYQFMEESEYFTISFYPEKYRDALGLMGSKSGRDCDKAAAAGLTPKEVSGTVTYEEAEITLLCKKIYSQDLNTENMPRDVIRGYYETEAPHRMYIGEVVDILYSHGQ